jgi:hypothetical protein
MNARKTTSLTALLSFILVILTSAVLYVAPQGRVAFWGDWRYLGLAKETWKAWHTNIGLLFVLSALLHITINLKVLASYLVNKSKQVRPFNANFNLALGLVAFISITTLLQLPPTNSLQTLNHTLKRGAAAKYGEPPYGHAENSTLKSFCRRMGIQLNQAEKQLTDKNLSFSSDETLAQIAKKNRTTPQAIYSLINPAEEESDTLPAIPRKPGFGFGRKTLKEVCENYELDITATKAHFEALGIRVQPEQTMKAIAKENDTEPIILFEALKQL